MKKYSVIFTLSFISYLIVLFAAPYISAQTWADLCLLIFLLSVIYQLCFLIFLRRKEGVGIGRGIARFFLYSLQVLSIYVIIQYGDMFFNGYQQQTLIGDCYGEIYYGFDAWKNNIFANIIYLSVLFTTFVYGVLYFIVGKTIGSKK